MNSSIDQEQEQQNQTQSNLTSYPTFIFPPATQKTVITTTTTTTLNFPPLILSSNFQSPSPSSISNHQINPDLYPLSNTPLPTDWTDRGVSFPLSNRSFARFNPLQPSSSINQSDNPHSTPIDSSSSPQTSRKRTSTTGTPVHYRITSSPSPPSRSKKLKLDHSNDQQKDSSSNLLDVHSIITPPDSNSNTTHQSDSSNSLHPLQSADGHLELATTLSLPNLTAEFARLPVAFQQYTLFNLLKYSRLPVLQFVQQMIGPALKKDFIRDLPIEISILILKKLDGTTLCKASCVSKTWYNLIKNSRSVWKHRLMVENLWIGDGSEEIDAEECAFLDQQDSSHREIDRFSRLWKAGVWRKSQSAFNPSNPLDEPTRPSESLVESIDPSSSNTPAALHQSSSRTLDNLSPSSLSASPPSPPLSSSPSSLSYTQQRSSNDQKDHSRMFNDDPFKLLYRKRFLTRRNWMKKEPKRTSFRGHALTVVTCIQFDWSKMVAASDDNVVHCYDLRTGTRLLAFNGHQGGVWALQYVGETLVTGSTDRTVRVWSMRTGRNTHVFHGHTSTVRCLQIVEPVNVNGKTGDQAIWEPPYPVIVTGSRDSTLRVWKLPSEDDEEYVGCPIPGSPDDEGVSVDANTTNRFHLHLLKGHTHAVRALAAKGRTMVSASYDCTVRAWDIMTGECTQVMTGHSQKIYSVVLDSTRGRCASGSMDNTVRLWDLKTGETIRILGEHSSLVGLLGLSPRRLVSAAADATLRVWDPDTGSCRHELRGHLGAITCFTHDEFRVVSGADGTLKLWNAENGVLVGDVLTGFSAVWQVSMDERFCVVAVQRGAESEYVVLDYGRSDGRADSPNDEQNAPAPALTPVV